MSDPFNQFMTMWAPSVGVEEAFRCWKIKDEEFQAAYVIPDLEPFKDTSGKHIGGRRAWREHLKSTGTEEMGHADLKTLTERHTARRDAYKGRMQAATAQSTPVPVSKDARPVEPSKTAYRVMERLAGRPIPDRPTLIKIAIEERMRK